MVKIIEYVEGNLSLRSIVVTLLLFLFFISSTLSLSLGIVFVIGLMAGNFIAFPIHILMLILLGICIQLFSFVFSFIFLKA